MSEFLLPSLGADMESARVVEWLVDEGDVVKSGDLVVVLETDKGAIDVEIFEDGVIERYVAPLDVELPVGTVLAIVRGADATGAGVAAPPPTAPAVPAAGEPGVTATAAVTAPPAVPAPRATGGPVRASPLARRLAREHGIDLGTVAGSGPDGAVVARDVRRAGPEHAAGQPRTPRRGFDAAAMRRAIGAAMTRAKRDIPHYYLSTQVCLAPALAWLA
ncbi:MAG: E3 binding domain-containing protein, partial [Gammaproteobacteria bacterium]